MFYSVYYLRSIILRHYFRRPLNKSLRSWGLQKSKELSFFRSITIGSVIFNDIMILDDMAQTQVLPIQIPRGKQQKGGSRGVNQSMS